MHSRYWLLALLSGFAGICNPASAALVDWSTLSWPSGSLTNSYDVDPGSPGNDVTITVSGNTGQLQPSLVSPNPQTPAITRGFDGGLGTSPKTLELAINLSNNTQTVTFTLTFSSNYTAGVNNVSFSLFDIDAANDGSGGSTYQDVIKSITATSILGTSIAPTITGVGPNASLSGTGTTQVLTGLTSTVDLGPGSGDANATISYNSALGIRSITFTYGGGAAFPDPTYQHIGIYNINYSVLPETDPTWFSFIACGLLVGWNVQKSVRASRAKQGRDSLKQGQHTDTPRPANATRG